MPTWLQRAPVLEPAGTLLAFSDVSWTLGKDADSFGPAHLHTWQRLRRAVLIAIGLMLIGYLALARTASEAASVGGLLAEQASSALAGGGATPPNQMLTGVFGVGFLVVSARRVTLVCTAQPHKNLSLIAVQQGPGL
jgi:hypothetical protein